MSSLKTRIQQLMNERGITNYYLSKKTGVSESTLSRFFSKGTKLNAKNLEAICKYFKVSEEWLLSGTIKEPIDNGEIENSSNDSDVSERIKDLLNESNITPYKVSNDTGISNSAFTRLFNGSTPHQSTIEKLSKYFGVNEHWIRTGNGEKYTDPKKYTRIKPTQNPTEEQKKQARVIFGKVLRELFEQGKVSIGQLKQIDIDQSRVESFLSGEQYPNLLEIAQISYISKVSIDELVLGLKTEKEKLQERHEMIEKLKTLNDIVESQNKIIDSLTKLNKMNS